MIRVLGIIGARLNSSRLPGKHLLDLAGKPLIARIFERLEQIPELDAIVLATTADDYNKPLAQWAQQSGKEVFAFAGDVNDLVGRVDLIVKQYEPQIVVYFCGDSPLIEPIIVSRMINGLRDHPDCDNVDLLCAVPGHRSIHEGLMPWPIKTWHRLVELATEASDREHVGSSLKKTDSGNHCQVVDDEVYSRIEHRISVDTPSDYQFMAEVYRRWYQNNPQDSIVSLSWVIEELQRDESLRLINEQVRQKGVLDKSAKVLLVSHCGEAVGLGHLRRSMVLARSLQDRFSAGVELVIAGSDVSLPGLELLPHSFIAPEKFSDGVLKRVADYHPDAVVVDVAADRLPDDVGALLLQLRRQQIVTVAVDGLFKHQMLLDLIFVPSFYVAPESLALVSAEKVVFGWDHYFLDPALQPRTWRAGNSVIVMTGGTDYYGLGSVWPAMLDHALPATAEITWIQGPYAKAPELPTNPRLIWRIERTPENLAQLMAQADYALTPYGVTLFELLKLAKPVVAYHPMSAQQAEINAFREAGAAWLETTPGAAVAALVELMGDEQAARRLVARAVDKIGSSNGAFNLASRVMALLERRE
jgi:spore coat polysaccharide biosynthesis protein SpsF (cytidylyltransferase family)